MLHMHMLFPTEPWSTESVRPRLTHSSSPLPHMLDTLDTPLLLPTLLLLSWRSCPLFPRRSLHQVAGAQVPC